MKCLMCGKEMYEVVDSIAKVKTGYNWRCDCMPKGIIFSMLGNNEQGKVKQ